MTLKPANRRFLPTTSKMCCLLVLAFAGAFCPLESANAALITSEQIASEQSMTSSQMRHTIDGSETQLGELSVWYDIGLSNSIAPAATGCSSGVSKSGSEGMFGDGSKSTEEQLMLMILPSMNFCVFVSSSNTGSTSGLSSSGFDGHGSSFLTAILVPQTRCPVPVLNHFWQGTDLIFVPPAVPDELLRPPQS
jgi:hypothetical protein